MTDVTINSKEYEKFKDATTYNFLQRKHKFKQTFNPASIREHIRYMQEIYDIRLDHKTNKDIYNWLIAFNDAITTNDTVYVPNLDVTLTIMNLTDKESDELLALTICGFHYGEPDEQSFNFLFDNVAIFDYFNDRFDTEDE